MQKDAWRDNGAALCGGERNCVTAWQALKAEWPNTAQRIEETVNPAEVRLVQLMIRYLD